LAKDIAAKVFLAGCKNMSVRGRPRKKRFRRRSARPGQGMWDFDRVKKAMKIIKLSEPKKNILAILT
jgi:transposase